MPKFVLVFLALLLAAPAEATESGWALLRDGGRVVLLAHGYTAGTTDPTNFDIEKCATQRNLSDRGKLQARKMGALFATRAAETERVLSSRYCRCLDTARLAFGGTVEPFEALDLFAADPAAAEAQKKAILDEIGAFSGSGNLVMVTHPATIAALLGTKPPREGEAVIVRPDGEKLHVLGRIIFN